MIQKQLQIPTQAIRFDWNYLNNFWCGSIRLSNQIYEIEIPLPNAINPEQEVNWEKVQNLLHLIETIYPQLLETSHKNLRYFVQESGLYSSYEVEQSTRMELEWIEVTHPQSPQPTFCLYFLFDAKSGIDLYSDWEISFLGKHLVGVKRIQR